MGFQFSIYLVCFAFTAVISIALCSVTARRLEKRTALQVFGLLLGIAIWSGADAVRIASTDGTVQAFAHDATGVGASLLVFSTVLFAVEYTNRERYLTRRNVALFALPFVVVTPLIATETLVNHGLLRPNYELVRDGGLVLFEPDWAPLYWVYVVFTYGLLVVVTVLYLIEFVREEPGTSYRRRLSLLGVGVVAPWIGSSLFIFGITLVDLTSVGFLVTGIVFYALIFRLDLLELIPIARSTAVDNVEHGFMVLGEGGRIVDVNESMASIVGRPRASIIGESAETVFRDRPEVLERFRGEIDTRETLALETDGERRHFDVDISPVYTRVDRYAGQVVLVRDVTEDRRREQRLREQTATLTQQNERLNQFANIVSHDLRNPLNVAQGYLDVERARNESANLEEIDTSLDRMEEIIEDVLALARQTTDSLEYEPVDLETVAEEAWGTAATRDGRLRLDSTDRFEADRSRLKQLLENLFRNAADHGGDDVAVMVGMMADGFYVEDDGPGIPADDRDAVFEHGYTSANGGTGFGLSVVAAIAESHGWSVRVTASASGGARFEITGIESAPESDRGLAEPR